MPTLLRSLEGRQATQVHVDDMMMTGDEEPTNKVVSTLKDKYEMKVQGPFGSPGDEWNFLKVYVNLHLCLALARPVCFMHFMPFACFPLYAFCTILLVHVFCICGMLLLNMCRAAVQVASSAAVLLSAFHFELSSFLGTA